MYYIFILSNYIDSKQFLINRNASEAGQCHLHKYTQNCLHRDHENTEMRPLNPITLQLTARISRHTQNTINNSEF